ncbi:MAG: DUF1345 domain-containing protein [Verrucomicrobiota bacterium]
MKSSILALRHRLSHLEAHHRLLISLSFAAVVFLLLRGRHSWRTQFILTWDSYALCVLVLAWLRIITSLPREVLRLATLQPSSRKLIFLFVVVASCASLSSVAILLGMAKGMTGWMFAKNVALGLVTVVLSWLVLHTMFALHYAFLFYREHHTEKSVCIARGLLFPEGDIEPDYFDFAYFSFVIGMTSQVSDVQINSREMRRWALLHGMVSFAFNTAVLALGINIISGLF